MKRGGGSVKCWRRVDLLVGQRLARRHRRQPAEFLVLLVVAAFLIELQEAVEADDLAGGAQIELAGAGVRHANLDGRALEFGRFHLAGDGALPDQFVEPRLVGLERAARSRAGSATDRSGGSPHALPARSWPCTVYLRGAAGT